MAPNHLVRLLNACTEVQRHFTVSPFVADWCQFIKLLKEGDQPGTTGDLCLRLVFCEFLASCTYTTLARAEDNVESCVSTTVLYDVPF